MKTQSLGSLWEDNAIQFTRLVAEVWAAGLTPGQWQTLLDELEMSDQQLTDVFEKAEEEWERLKEQITRRRKRWLPGGLPVNDLYAKILTIIKNYGLFVDQATAIGESMDVKRKELRELLDRAAEHSILAGD